MPPIPTSEPQDPKLEPLAFRLLEEGRLEEGARILVGLASNLESRDCAEKALILQDYLLRALRRVPGSDHDLPAYDEVRNRWIPRIHLLGKSAEPISLFNELLSEMIDVDRVAIETTTNPLVRRAQNYIDEHYQQKISLSAVAGHLHISPNYLSRLFRQESGMTLTQHIQRTRLEHAMLLLADGEKSISEIAYLVGYQNYRDFYRNFVKYENAAPRQVRRRFSEPLDRLRAN